MQLSRRLASAIAVISLLIASSVLAIISFREGFSTVILREGSLKSIKTKWKREDAGTLFLSFPWKWHGSAEDTKTNAKVNSDTVVTITVCTPAETLSTVAVRPSNAIQAAPQNSNGSINTRIANAGSRETASLLGASACSIHPSTLSACVLIPTSAGYVCQYYPPTVYPTDCSGCVKTSTVTNTYLSTITNCHATQFSFTAVANFTLTANLSTSVAARTTNTTLAIASSNSAQASQEFSLLPNGNSSLSALICPHGALAKRQRGCVPSLATSPAILSSVASPAPTLFELVPNSTRPVLASQTLFLNLSNSTNLVNNSTGIRGSIATGILGKVTKGGNSTTAVFSTGGHSSVINVTSNALAGTDSIPSIVSTSSRTSVDDLPSSFTSNRITIPSLTLPSMVPGASSASPDILNVLNSALAGVTSAEGVIISILGDVKSAASSVLPVIPSIPSLTFSPVSGITAIIDPALPIATSLPTVLDTVLSDFNSVTNSVAPPIQSSISSTVRDFTAVNTPVLSVAVVVNEGGNVVASVVEPITSATLPRITDITNVTPAVLNGRLLKDATSPAIPGISMATSMTGSVMGDTPGVVTVTRIIRVVTISVSDPPPVSSM